MFVHLLIVLFVVSEFGSVRIEYWRLLLKSEVFLFLFWFWLWFFLFSALVSLEMCSALTVAFKFYYEQVWFTLKFNKGSLEFLISLYMFINGCVIQVLWCVRWLCYSGSLKYVSGCVCTGTRNGLVLPASVLDHVNRVYKCVLDHVNKVYKCFTLYCPLSITVSL